MDHKELLTALSDYYGGDRVAVRVGRKLADIKGVHTEGTDIIIEAEWIVKEKEEGKPDTRNVLPEEGGAWLCIYTLGDNPRWQRFSSEEQAQDYNVVAYHGLGQVIPVSQAPRRFPDLFR